MFDASQAIADFSLSSSNVDITTNSGYATVKLTLGGGSVVANAFPWSRQGDLIVAQNPSAINSWIGTYMGDIAEIDVDLGSLSATGGTELNTLASEAVYSGVAHAGTANSWYNQPCDPSDPSGQCQIE